MFKEIPFSTLAVSPLNARKTVRDVTGLAANIEAKGILQPLIVSPVDGDRFEIFAGQRRYLAIKKLIEGGESARFADGDALVPCMVDAEGDGAETSLAENYHRETMHPADEFEAFDALTRSGRSPAEIAHRFGVGEHHVVQRMKLARLSPAVLDAFRDGMIDLDTAKAMTVTDDHGRQDNMLRVIAKSPYHSDAYIRQQLTSDKVSANSALGRFVRDAYLSEGHPVTEDLFGDQVWLDDAAAVEAIGVRLLYEKGEGLKAAGWGWVRSALHFNVSLYDDTVSVDGDLEPASDDDDFDYSPELRARCGCIVYLTHGGLTVMTGRMLVDAAPDGDLDQSPGETVAAAEASESTTPGLSRALIDTLSIHRTRALQEALAADQSTAFSLLLLNLYKGVSRRGVFVTSPANVSAHGAYPFEEGDEAVSMNRAERALREALERFEATIQVKGPDVGGGLALFDRINALAIDEKLAAIALLVGLSVQAPMDGGSLGTNKLAEHIGGILGVDTAASWRPDADFFNRVSLRVVEATVPLGNGVEKVRRMKKPGRVAALSTWFANPGDAAPADLGYDGELPGDVAGALTTWLPAGMAFSAPESDQGAETPDDDLPEYGLADFDADDPAPADDDMIACTLCGTVVDEPSAIDGAYCSASCRDQDATLAA